MHTKIIKLKKLRGGVKINTDYNSSILVFYTKNVSSSKENPERTWKILNPSTKFSGYFRTSAKLWQLFSSNKNYRPPYEKI